MYAPVLAGGWLGIVMGVLVFVAVAAIVGAYAIKQKQHAKFGDKSVREQGDLEMELVANDADN